MTDDVLLKEFGEEFLDLYHRVAPFTITSPDRMFALYTAADYVARFSIPGDFVECGVWRGGSAMLVAHTLLRRGDTHRNLFLFDTFEGMTRPDERDIDRDGQPALAQWLSSGQNADGTSPWCYAGLDEVRENMISTTYPANRIHLIQGDVKTTLPHPKVGGICILRLDTDWYESTKHELQCLYDRVSTNGILIIDDYGHWKGARQAVDEYFALRGEPVLFNRIDTTGRLITKVAI